MRGYTVDVITRTKIFDSQFMGFRVLINPILPFYIGLAGRPHSSVSTSVLHCDTNSIPKLIWTVSTTVPFLFFGH